MRWFQVTVCFHFQDSESPRNLTIGLTRSSFVPDALKEEAEIRRLYLKLLIKPNSEQFAMTDTVGPSLANVSHIRHTGKGFVLRGC